MNQNTKVILGLIGGLLVVCCVGGFLLVNVVSAISRAAFKSGGGEISRPGSSYQDFLGKNVYEDRLLILGCQLDFNYVCKFRGVELSTDANGKIVTVWLYAQGADGFQQFEGKLPYGLTWQDTRAEVERKLGLPSESHEGIDEIKSWALYQNGELLITYNTVSAQDPSALMYSILVKSR
jgi:hypothetical protein